MPSERDLRRRVRSVKNIQQLTRAMQLVAASKMRRAQEAVLASRPFEQIRVELQSLAVQDFEAILTSTHASLVKQYQALLATEGVKLDFKPEGITRLASLLPAAAPA